MISKESQESLDAINELGSPNRAELSRHLNISRKTLNSRIMRLKRHGQIRECVNMRFTVRSVDKKTATNLLNQAFNTFNQRSIFDYA